MKNNYLNNEFYFEWWQIINPVSKTWKKIINPFVPFFTPCKHQKTVRWRERVHLERMG